VGFHRADIAFYLGLFSARFARCLRDKIRLVCHQQREQFSRLVFGEIFDPPGRLGRIEKIRKVCYFVKTVFVFQILQDFFYLLRLALQAGFEPLFEPLQLAGEP